ncbi:MAG: ABC transporter substrate-binding protein [Actinomycetota bacterium]|nr:ABC transporter substrate-binding protein [Actinomycetota bacterium]
MSTTAEHSTQPAIGMRRPKRRRHRGVRAVRLAVVLASVGMVLAACGSSTSASVAATSGPGATPKQMTAVSFNEYPGTPYSWLLNFAQGEGFFAKNGINATLVPTSGAPPAFAGLVSNSLQFASGDMINGGVVQDSGTPLEIVAGLMKGNQTLLIGSKSANLPTGFPAGIKGLAGKPVGVVSIGSAAYYYMELFLKAAGMSVSSVNYLATTVAPASLIAALDSQRVSAAVVSLATGYGLAVDDHDPVLFNMDTITGSLFPGSVPNPSILPTSAPLHVLANRVHQYLWASKPWAKSHRSVVKKVQLALEETDVWLHNPNNLNAAVVYLTDHGEVTKFPGETAQQLHAFLVTEVPLLVSYVPSADVSAFQNVYVSQGVLPKVLPLSQFIASGVPGSASAVVAQVKAAGQGSLGSSA